MIWVRMLAYITGTLDQELLLKNEYLAAENRILRAQIKGRLLLSDAEKATLAEIAHRLGRKALEELSAVATPNTLLAWYRKLIAGKFDGSKFRKSRGRPRVDEETERLVVRMAKENPGWGYDRIVGTMANLGLRLSGRHEQQTRTSDSDHGVLDVWLSFCGAGGFETYGGGILVVVEGDATIPGVSGPQRGVSSGWLPMLLLAEA